MKERQPKESATVEGWQARAAGMISAARFLNTKERTKTNAKSD